MKAIIYKTESGAEKLQSLLFDTIKPLVDSNTTKYSNVIKHTLKDLWAVQIAEGGKFWDVISEVVKGRKIKTLKRNWFPQNDLEI